MKKALLIIPLIIMCCTPSYQTFLRWFFYKDIKKSTWVIRSLNPSAKLKILPKSGMKDNKLEQLYYLLNQEFITNEILMEARKVKDLSENMMLNKQEWSSYSIELDSGKTYVIEGSKEIKSIVVEVENRVDTLQIYYANSSEFYTNHKKVLDYYEKGKLHLINKWVVLDVE